MTKINKKEIVKDNKYNKKEKTLIVKKDSEYLQDLNYNNKKKEEKNVLG